MAARSWDVAPSTPLVVAGLAGHVGEQVAQVPRGMAEKPVLRAEAGSVWMTHSMSSSASESSGTGRSRAEVGAAQGASSARRRSSRTERWRES